MDSSLPGSSVHGILQARILEWVAISFSRGTSPPRDWTQVSHIAGRCFTLWATREALQWHIGHLPTGVGRLILCWNIFLPFHSVHGVLDVRMLDWAAISFSSGPHVVGTLHYDQTVLGTTNTWWIQSPNLTLDRLLVPLLQNLLMNSYLFLKSHLVYFLASPLFWLVRQRLE